MVGEDLLHGRLVHAGCAPQHPAAYVGNAGELEHALYGAVLAVGTVQYGEDHVHGAQSRGKLLRYGGRWARDVEIGAVGKVAAFRLQLAHRLSGGDPTPLPGYADGHDFVTSALPQRLGYGARGGQGHLMLPAAAPENDHHPDQCAAPLFSSPPILAKGSPDVRFRPPAARNQAPPTAPSELRLRTLCVHPGPRLAPRRPLRYLPCSRPPRRTSASSSCGRSLPSCSPDPRDARGR